MSPSSLKMRVLHCFETSGLRNGVPLFRRTTEALIQETHRAWCNESVTPKVFPLLHDSIQIPFISLSHVVKLCFSFPDKLLLDRFFAPINNAPNLVELRVQAYVHLRAVSVKTQFHENSRREVSKTQAG